MGRYTMDGSLNHCLVNLNAMDMDEAQRVIEQCLHENSLRDLYDSVFIPVLILAERNKRDAAFGGDRGGYLFQGLKGIVENLAVRYTKENAQIDASQPLNAAEQILADRSGNAPAIAVCCLAARDEGDEVAGVMLAHLLLCAGYDAHSIGLGPHANMLDEVGEKGCGILYISALPPFGISSIRRLYKRTRSKSPQSRIGIALWGYDGEIDKMKTLLRI